MKVFVKVKPKAKEEKIQKLNDSHYLILTKQMPVKGKANQAALKMLAEYFKTSPNKIRIVSGLCSKQKIIKIT